MQKMQQGPKHKVLNVFIKIGIFLITLNWYIDFSVSFSDQELKSRPFGFDLSYIHLFLVK